MGWDFLKTWMIWLIYNPFVSWLCPNGVSSGLSSLGCLWAESQRRVWRVPQRTDGMSVVMEAEMKSLQR